jgi:hypothetical protein
MFQITCLEDLDLLRESADLECKRAAGRDGQGELPAEFWKSYSAMANSDGGTILLGLKEQNGHFELQGLPQPDRVLKQLFDMAGNRNKVSLNLLEEDTVRVIVLEGRSLLQIQIPRATRQQRPVYLNGNPLGNTYVRRHEGDYRLSDDAVKRMLAEQSEDSRDTRILKGFGLEDLNRESLNVYRQAFMNLQANHPWNELPMEAFLQKVGAMRRDREAGGMGLTAAGLLMFGNHPVIQEAFPYYMLDYQERPEARTERRWIDLLPQSLVDELRGRFGPDYDDLPHEDRVALAIAATEGTVSHQRLCSLVDLHPADASLCLHELVQEGFLEKTGSSRGAIYHLAGVQIPGPEDVFDLPEGSVSAASGDVSSPHLEPSSPHLESSSPHLVPSSPLLESSSPQMERDASGRLLAPSYDLPFVDRLDVLEPDFLRQLHEIAHEPRSKGRLPRATITAVLQKLLDGHFIALSCLAELVDRDPKALRDRYLRGMIQANEVRIAFPRTPNDPRQAYTKADA